MVTQQFIEIETAAGLRLRFAQAPSSPSGGPVYVEAYTGVSPLGQPLWAPCGAFNRDSYTFVASSVAPPLAPGEMLSAVFELAKGWADERAKGWAERKSDGERRSDLTAADVDAPTTMLLGLVRAAESLEQRDGGELWDNEGRAALARARQLGWGAGQVGAPMAVGLGAVLSEPPLPGALPVTFVQPAESSAPVNGSPEDRDGDGDGPSTAGTPPGDDKTSCGCKVPSMNTVPSPFLNDCNVPIVDDHSEGAWSPSEVALLRSLVRSQASVAERKERLGRTQHSIAAKIWRLREAGKL